MRYRSWGTEELLVKCCMKYLPWLRRIHILLAQESQKQDWMERYNDTSEYRNNIGPTLHVIFHRDFIPKEYLPCFASPCMEMFLHKIPELSEYFIYANDDMFPLSPLEPEDFFRPMQNDGQSTKLLPCQHITHRVYPSKPGVFQRKCMWQQNMIGAPFGLHFTDTYPDTGHIFSAILKSSCEEVWKRHGDEITAHLSPLTRTDRSANNWIYQLYQQYSGTYIDHCPPRHYTDQDTPTSKIASIIRDPQAGIVCINDNEHIGDWRERASIVRREIANKLKMENEKCKTMKVALVAIGRIENRYAREFVEHHLRIGFDCIHICDNNHDGEERFEDVLQEYIDTGRVHIHDYRNQVAVQQTAYNDIYKQYGSQYDWIAFFDFDEFLVMNDGRSMKEWLALQPADAETVPVNWMCMTDGGMVRDDGRPLIERFTEAMPYDRCVQYNFPDNNHVKSFVRGGLFMVRFKNPHVPITPQNPNPSAFRFYDFSVCCLKHFTTKTISEWLTGKCRRGVGDRPHDSFARKYKGRFFKYNTWTKEKQQYIDAFTQNSADGLTAAIVHYNTPKLTRAAILSLWKHTPGCRVVVFDNSDKRPFAGCRECYDVRWNPLVTIIDNTKGQEVNFDELLALYPERQLDERNKSNFGSAKHTASVDRLFDLLPDGFLLMDSDVLVFQDVRPLMDRSIAAAGTLKPNEGVMRLLPLLCWLNVPFLREHGIRYFNGEKMWALSQQYPNNRYDTGAWVLEEINRYNLPMRQINTKDYVIHLGHASWKEMKPMAWVNSHRSLWE